MDISTKVFFTDWRSLSILGNEHRPTTIFNIHKFIVTED